MDELNLLQDLHREIPGPSAAEAAAARARLLTAIGDPRSAALCRLVAARRPAVLKRLARPRLWAPVAAAAAVTAIVITAVSITTAPGPPAIRSGSARGTITATYALKEAASAAVRQIPGHGQFFATEVELISPARPSAKPVMATVWWGNSAVRWNRGGAALTGFPYGTVSSMPWPITFLRQVPQLPGGPVQLLADLAKMTRGIAGPTRFVEFWAVCMILAYFPASPALRAALYRAAATLPGLKLIPRARDPLGRVGAEVYGLSGTTGGSLSSEVAFFDPATGALLDYQVYRVGQAPAEPQCSSFLSAQIALLASGYVGSTSQLPPGAPTSPEPVAQPAAHGCPSTGGPQPSAPARSR
jgi:hypothetical protein